MNLDMELEEHEVYTPKPYETKTQQASREAKYEIRRYGSWRGHSEIEYENLKAQAYREAMSWENEEG